METGVAVRGSKLSGENGFLQFMIDRLLQSDAPSGEAVDPDEIDDADDYLAEALGSSIQADIDTEDLYKEALKKFDIWHIGFKDKCTEFVHYDNKGGMRGWKNLLGNHFVVATSQTLDSVIGDIIKQSFSESAYVTAPANTFSGANVNTEGFIDW